MNKRKQRIIQSESPNKENVKFKGILDCQEDIQLHNCNSTKHSQFRFNDNQDRFPSIYNKKPNTAQTSNNS